MALRNIRFAQLILAIFPITLALAGCIGAAAQSQSTAENAGFTRTARLKEGTEVRLKLRDKLTSKTAVEGDPVNLMLDQDLKVGNITVAKAGALAVGTISHADKAGMVGRPGNLGLRLEYVKANDSEIRLRGVQGKQGKGKEGAAVALTIVFGPVGLIKHGKNAEFKAGTPLVGYVDEGIDLPALD
jgi:hypothetical protein